MTRTDLGPHNGILHVVDTLETGGLERVVSDLAIAQHREGRRVAVFSLLATDGFRAELEAAGVPVLIGNKRHGLDRALLGHLRGVLRERAIDVIHTHNFVPHHHAALAAIGLARRPLLVNTVHNMGTRLGNRRLRWLYRAALWRTARVAMVGEPIRRHFVDAGIVAAARAQTVLNGIPVERFASGAQRRATARAALGLADDALVIGCVGRLVALKNHRQMIEVMPSLLARFDQLRLVILGDGPLAGELRALATTCGISDRVLLAGARSNVAELLPAFDVFAQPSLTEGMSIALLEAAASGLAILASRVGGNVDIISDGQTGCLVPVADAAALGDGLAALLGDAEGRHRLGAAAATWVRANASIEAMRDAYAQFYEAARCSRK